MLVKNTDAANSVKVTAVENKRSKLWLIFVFAFFAFFIYGILWWVLRFGFLSIPFLNDRFYEKTEPSYVIEVPANYNVSLLDAVYYRADRWHLLLDELELSALLQQFMGEGWQIIVNPDSFELYGPIMSAINDENHVSYVKILYTVNEEPQVIFNEIELPRFISDLLIQKHLA